MSFAPSTLRHRGTRRSTAGEQRTPGPRRAGTRDADLGNAARNGESAAADDTQSELRDWGRVGAFSAGVAVGALLGAGVALLIAPLSGPETRTILRRQARGLGRRATGAWDELGDELRWAARRGRRDLRRRIRHGRYTARTMFVR